jgi:predicted nucleotide-binding protein
MGSKLIERFEGVLGRPTLEEALLQQKLVLGNEKLASLLAEQGSLHEVDENAVLIKEGDEDNEVYLIITGNFKIKVHDREIANRGAGEHVGEMAALVNTATRSATVIATEPSIVLKVSADGFKAAANEHPRIWQYVIRQLVERLNQRNELVRPSHEAALIFIICSIEALPIAREIERQFEHDKFFVKIWTEGTFRASQYTLESLEDQLDQSDFAIAIAQADDEVVSRGEQQVAPRDNVIFELGMFVGRLGRERSILLEPRGEGVRLPSDLKGLTTITYRPPTGTERFQIGSACSDLRDIFNSLGPR